jgi:hypothetical protein
LQYVLPLSPLPSPPSLLSSPPLSLSLSFSLLSFPPLSLILVQATLNVQANQHNAQDMGHVIRLCMCTENRSGPDCSIDGKRERKRERKREGEREGEERERGEEEEVQS